ncbi:bifunctional glutamate N-acetyltransferase/amino-acid acetyltransferase ArgJ [Sulfobacillus thermosulfidooxidans]|uniref:bifunctional glutamate N-acetyltransferase/amino-acid acetyltransferase ArgJ n=1 Tax=Sulfobacillus thermosulfidooxidans TaxID=28034 RepID=UPI00096B9CD1|nr:bifunctional glutamate N-acetyltransferase/amino-acid acetyltransferase ArgJ [Sulfobacillus thermosulfidooxidans]OLZ08115.1 bifunctional ornithine acetyltransferase/N-acetylglutamate synthase [Sulfobacillus thermosulfidooxidans]OLZ16529.1 bifunctional ornithine acetyltransferase/N-acetylglutamate synthase [Sulfobacillus thermosulfidooxidans]OLZ19616.1 bifunctional ornithine acetyltransferase/N-acetylglutamate synthase [Sulfobacillus thermosulfidooxidans]
MTRNIIEPALAHMTWKVGNVTTPLGFKAFGTASGILKGRPDMALIWSVKPAVVSGLFTTNTAKAWPVLLTQKTVYHGLCQAVIINAGNANAATGPQGEKDAALMQERTARGLNIPPSFVAVASTGVIGVPLPMDKIDQGIHQLLEQWEEHRDCDGKAASEAILTTDQVPKVLAAEVTLPEGTVHMGLMAKGSGMIHPNMATMLAFVTTDAVIDKELQDHLLRQAVDRSFHRISVDGDPSTNDMVLMMANGLSRVAIETPESIKLFQSALTHLLRQGARMIADDGEGATHLITCHVKGAPSEEDAAQKARAVVRSNLVKAAIYGQDPNWGRILAAIGTTPGAFDPDHVAIRIGDLTLFDQDLPTSFDENEAKDIMGQHEVVIEVDLHNGSYEAEAWGCDLTERYVEINAHYRT